MFKLNTRRGLIERVKGLLTRIPYEVRVPDGNWSPFFGDYNNQKWGEWDSNSCWALASINSIEDQCEWLWKNDKFSPEARQFFINYGYIDSDGDFSFSERFIEILSGAKDKGNAVSEAWRIVKEYGLIPRIMLDYSKERANRWANKEDFNRDYFNRGEITDGMLDLGQECLKYLNFAYQQIGSAWTTPDVQLMRTALRQAPLLLGIPVDIDEWNKPSVRYFGKQGADHAVECYFVTTDVKHKYKIFDQYQPHLKDLSTDYYIPLCSQGVVTVTAYGSPKPPVPPEAPKKKSVWTLVFEAVHEWFASKGMITPYP